MWGWFPIVLTTIRLLLVGSFLIHKNIISCQVHCTVELVSRTNSRKHLTLPVGAVAKRYLATCYKFDFLALMGEQRAAIVWHRVWPGVALQAFAHHCVYSPQIGTVANKHTD